MNANIIYTIFFFILPIRKSALLPLKIKMKESTVSPTVLFFMPFSPAFPPLPCRITQGRTGGGEAGSGGGRGGLDPPGWADRREIVVRKMGENEKKA